MKKVVMVALPLVIVFFLCNILIHLFSGPQYIDAISFKTGVTGPTVKKIEQKLKTLGFFKGNPDNYYGTDTSSAVKRFQASRGLKADGIAGDKTLKALGISTGTASSKAGSYASKSEVALLSRIINGEARGESYVGQVAIGAVILNRTRDPRFPQTISGVVYQPGAFTAVSDGQISAPLESTPTKAAQDALNGWDPTGGCVFYYNPAKTTNKWIWSRPVIKIIGKHHFCK